MTITVYNKSGTSGKVITDAASWRLDEKNNLLITGPNEELTVYAEGSWGIIEVEVDG